MTSKLATGHGFAQPENAEISFKKAKSQKALHFAKNCTFRLSAQISHFSSFRAKIQKVFFSQKTTLFATPVLFNFSGKDSKSFPFRKKKVSLFDFSVSFLTFRFLRKNSKSQTFRNTKRHLSQNLSLFDFSGKTSKVNLFAKSVTFGTTGHFSIFRAKTQNVLLFGKSVTFRLVGQFSHFLPFRAEIRKVKLFAKSCTFRSNCHFSTFPAKNPKVKKVHCLQKGALFGHFSLKKVHFSTFEALFAKSCIFPLFGQRHFFDFSSTFRTKFYFSQKLHFSASRAV